MEMPVSLSSAGPFDKLSELASTSAGRVSTSSGRVSAVIAAVWRQNSARVVAGLTRMTRDLGVAEDLAQDALVQALEQWPRDGLPDNPGAWLMSTAKRRAVDSLPPQRGRPAQDRELGHTWRRSTCLI